MIDGIEELYQRIADSMVGEIPEEEWISATCEARFYPGSSSYEAEYLGTREGKPRSLAPTSDGPKAFRELRKLFKEAGRPLWGRAVFTIFPDGKFGMTFDYDGCDEKGNAVFDADEYLRRGLERSKRLGAE